MSAPWQITTNAARLRRQSHLPKEWLLSDEQVQSLGPTQCLVELELPKDVFSDKEDSITRMSGAQLVEQMKERKLTATEVLTAFAKRATVAQQLFNCVTEVMFDDAFKRAAELDKIMEETGRPVGPLHGLPISLKDQFNVKGHVTSIAYVAQATNVAESNSLLVDHLITLGAVPFVKTTLPVSIMSEETFSNLFGLTLNPWNRELSPGGSSGGEAALIAFRGSPMGVGSDLMGSLRKPAAYCGLWTMRPSVGRVPYKNVTNTLNGMQSLQSALGPLCTSADSIELFFRSILDLKPWTHDPRCLPIPWRKELVLVTQRLSFGWSMGDPLLAPTPPLRRAMEIVKAKLEAAGHEIIEWMYHDPMVLNQVISKCVEEDGGDEIRSSLRASGEPLPDIVKWLVSEEPLANAPTGAHVWANNVARQAYEDEHFKRWQATAEKTTTGRPIDALIMPNNPHVAPLLGRSLGAEYHVSPFGFFAPFLDLTSAVFPVTTVNSTDVWDDIAHPPVTDGDHKARQWYQGPETQMGVPVGLELIGRRLEEEKMVGLLKVIEEVLQG